ncbi:MAG: hypothetical protein NTY38_00030 [Acidobacteria bacterium]|nr:hypothetical protein [Acidobacteriota bacterium]
MVETPVGWKAAGEKRAAIRSAILWTGLLVLCAISGYYFLEGERVLGLDGPHNWSRSGLRRLAWFTGLYFPVAFLLVRWRTSWFLPLALGSTTVYTIMAAGAPATATAALFFLACYCLGDRVLGVDTEKGFWLPTAAGGALYLAMMSVTAALPVHYVPVYLVLLLAPVVWNWRRLAGKVGNLARRSIRPASWALPILVYVLLLHWFVVLKPEVSADGLSMHLAIPAEVAFRHFWSSDFHHKTWAVMPMGGDWLYTLVYLPGGEMAARLLNFGMLGLLAGLLFELSGSLLAVALFLSTPLVQLETGSLFVGAILTGAALSVKFASMPFCIPLVILLGWELRRHGTRHVAGIALLCFLAIAAPPYLNSGLRTGSPLFPYMNRVFRSPHFDQTINILEQRYSDRLQWSSLFQVVFQTHRFLEGYDGSAGFHLAILAPLSLLAFGRKTPWRVCIAALIAIEFAVASFSAMSYVRYLYPAMALITIPIGWLLSSTGGWIRVAVAGVGFGLMALNIWFLPSSGHWHRELFLPLRSSARDVYITELAPGRKMVDYLNARHPGEATAFLKHNQVAGLRAPVHQNSWHDWECYLRLQAAGTAEDVARIADDNHIRYFVVPAPGGRDLIEPEPVRQFAERYTETEFTAGALSVARWKPGASRTRGGGAAVLEFDQDGAASCSRPSDPEILVQRCEVTTPPRRAAGARQASLRVGWQPGVQRREELVEPGEVHQ